MAHYKKRDLLSKKQKFRRSYYELLRDSIEDSLIEESLIVSYNNFKEAKTPYPFVEKKELRPRAIVPNTEYDLHKSFLVIFLENHLENIHKKYIRFLDLNKTTKANISFLENIDLKENFHRNIKYIEDANFLKLFKKLLNVDYSLLIQKTVQKEDKYSISHFHVKIDWPVTEAAENLAKRLRYISQDIYENGEKYAEEIEKKFFEYYGLPIMAGGRRTAAIVATEYLTRLPSLSTVYVSSNESRSLLKIFETGLARYILIKINKKSINTLLKDNNITPEYFEKNYIIEKHAKSFICIFRTSYYNTTHSLPPADGKLRKLKMEPNWLSVVGQHIIPKPGTIEAVPIKHKIIY